MFLVGLNGFVKTINLIFSPHKSQKSQFLSNMENYVQIDRMSNLHINVPSEILKRWPEALLCLPESKQRLEASMVEAGPDWV